jgi:predicted adenylyl cyclase CyaB
LENEAKKLDPHCEFETKYKVGEEALFSFKTIVQSLPGLDHFIYVEGPDIYWTKGEDFFRYRKAAHEKENIKAWLTMKQKPDGAKNNIQRKEVNWRVDVTPFETIREGVEMLGFKYNFKIYKMCHIYFFNDATVVFYTVKDESKGDLTHFVEIEVKEETIGDLTEEQAWEVVKKYEGAFAPLGITSKNRLRKSLFEMYRRPE